MNLARCAVLLVLLLTATPVGAQYGRADDLQPKTYTSPSGEFVLSVDPSQRSGAGKALYALKRNGTVVWSAEHPFTLWDAVLADDGTTGGYAYSRGYNYDGGARGQGDFVVAILDTGGKLRLAERTAREASRFLHRMPDPQADGLFIDAHNDRLVVRVVDPDVNAGVESWWTYHLSDGKSAGKSRPRELMHDPEAARWVIDARPVAQTPLTLVHWYRLASESDQWQTGARFTLVDLQSKPVWTLELPRDYTISDDEDAQEQLRNAIHEHGAILDTTQPSRFELRHVAAGERVTYAVARDADTPHGWKVTEVARTPYADSQSDANKPAQRAQVPEVALRRLGSIELEGVGRSASPIQAVADFQIDDRGRIGFLRHRAAELALVIVDHAGKPVREVVLPKRSPRGDGSTHAAWVIDDRWLVTISEDGREQKSSAFWVDIDTGRVTPLAKFSAPPIESLVGSRDGGFVALTRSQSRYTVEDALNAFDERGVKRWVVDAQHGDDTKLFSPEDIAVTATGEIVVLENIANKLKVYGRDGAHRTTLDLAEIWGRKPNYPSGIAADPGGGVVVHDFAGKPSIVHMALDGKIRGAFSPA
jgi:hypothetical protein